MKLSKMNMNNNSKFNYNNLIGKSYNETPEDLNMKMTMIRESSIGRYTLFELLNLPKLKSLTFDVYHDRIVPKKFSPKEFNFLSRKGYTHLYDKSDMNIFMNSIRNSNIGPITLHQLFRLNKLKGLTINGYKNKIIVHKFTQEEHVLLFQRNFIDSHPTMNDYIDDLLSYQSNEFIDFCPLQLKGNFITFLFNGIVTKMSINKEVYIQTLLKPESVASSNKNRLRFILKLNSMEIKMKKDQLIQFLDLNKHLSISLNFLPILHNH